MLITARQRIARKAELVHDPSTDEVFLNDALGVLRRYIPVPRPFGIHHADWPAGADPQTVALRPVVRAVRAGDVELLQALLQVGPGSIALVWIDAIGSDADEEMPRQLANAELGRRFERRLALLSHQIAIITEPQGKRSG